MVKVLLIDDDIKLLEVYERIFQLKGFDVVACSLSLIHISEPTRPY